MFLIIKVMIFYINIKGYAHLHPLYPHRPMKQWSKSLHGTLHHQPSCKRRRFVYMLSIWASGVCEVWWGSHPLLIMYPCHSAIQHMLRVHPTMLHYFLPEVRAGGIGDDLTPFPGVCFRVVFDEHFTSREGAWGVGVVHGRAAVVVTPEKGNIFRHILVCYVYIFHGFILVQPCFKNTKKTGKSDLSTYVNKTLYQNECHTKYANHHVTV